MASPQTKSSYKRITFLFALKDARSSHQKEGKNYREESINPEFMFSQVLHNVFAHFLVLTPNFNIQHARIHTHDSYTKNRFSTLELPKHAKIFSIYLSNQLKAELLAFCCWMILFPPYSFSRFLLPLCLSLLFFATSTLCDEKAGTVAYRNKLTEAKRATC